VLLGYLLHCEFLLLFFFLNFFFFFFLIVWFLLNSQLGHLGIAMPRREILGVYGHVIYIVYQVL
jgi:hypothetical protein